MPEYFDISLIAKKTNTSKADMEKCLRDGFGLLEGENNVGHFPDQNVLVTFIEGDTRDFDEISVGFPNLIFHKQTFETEFKRFVSFVNFCFECSQELQYAVCSYEMNGYLLGRIERIEDFKSELLSKFPITFKRLEGKERPELLLNFEAQKILR